MGKRMVYMELTRAPLSCILYPLGFLPAVRQILATPMVQPDIDVPQL